MDTSLCAEFPLLLPSYAPNILGLDSKHWVQHSKHTTGQFRTHLGTGMSSQLKSRLSPVPKSEYNNGTICICISTSAQKPIHIFVLGKCWFPNLNMFVSTSYRQYSPCLQPRIRPKAYKRSSCALNSEWFDFVPEETAFPFFLNICIC